MEKSAEYTSTGLQNGTSELLVGTHRSTRSGLKRGRSQKAGRPNLPHSFGMGQARAAGGGYPADALTSGSFDLKTNS